MKIQTDNKIYFKLEFVCGHSRKTRAKFPESDLTHPEYWIGGAAYCDECETITQVTFVKGA